MTVALERPTAIRLSPTVQVAGIADLPAIEAHMRAMLPELGGHDPVLHADVDDLARSYLGHRDRVLLVAVDPDGSVAGTASVRPGGPRPEFVPRWMAERYASRSVGQVCRVWVAPTARRRGVGQALAGAAIRWATERFDVVCLHTNASVPGALDFWRAFPGVVEVHDSRPDPWSTVHFEVCAPRP
ncbi:GNAT family N-acetyltransferase [Actinomycetospora atypica]|uniref:GNAT family N-acetyltransferase n=1 Tax=Actinomycetospora atypica TaxID=1290095 RepID=A0ABV9YSA0_9PSEU